jgi:hypothetical protein
MSSDIACIHGAFSLFSGSCGDRRETVGSEEGIRTPGTLQEARILSTISKSTPPALTILLSPYGVELSPHV